MAVHDPINGLRVGALAGGLLGALITAMTSVTNAWLVMLIGVIGGAVGFWTEKNRQAVPPREPSDGEGPVDHR
jgi:hypothetical protein